MGNNQGDINTLRCRIEGVLRGVTYDDGIEALCMEIANLLHTFREDSQYDLAGRLIPVLIKYYLDQYADESGEVN